MDQLKEILNKVTEQESLEEKLLFLNNNVSEKIVFSTSFGFEDQVISHAIFYMTFRWSLLRFSL